MSYNSYDINVLVNGKRCKQYNHNGKTYIESKDGSNYTLEIKNNTGNRILAVSSVDGLNVLDGKSASPSDNGYVVDSYSRVEIKGFRCSDDHVGAFEFTRKGRGDGYAATKGDQTNVGVIGFRLFNEVYRPIVRKYTPYDITYRSSTTADVDDSFYKGATTKSSSKTRGSSGGDRSGLRREATMRSATFNFCSADYGSMRDEAPDFDMATKWGQKLDSKVKSVNFERGCQTFSLDIYYASRAALIEMGICLSNEQKVSAPQSFPGNYAEPPKGWKG